MSFTLDYGLGALRHRETLAAAENASLEWSLSCQGDSGYKARHRIPGVGREKKPSYPRTPTPSEETWVAAPRTVLT